MKINQLLDVKKCNYKGYISSLNLKTDIKTEYVISNVYKQIILNILNFHKNVSKQDIKQMIIESLDSDLFLTNKQYDSCINTMSTYITRYINYQYKQNDKIKNIDGIHGTVNINNIEIDVNADVIFENANVINIVKFVVSKPLLNPKARSVDKLPENDIQLFMMKKLGEQIYGTDKTIISSYYHIKGKNDGEENYLKCLKLDNIKHLYDIIETYELNRSLETDKRKQKSWETKINKVYDVINYDNTIGNNIITFNTSHDLTDEIIELLNIKLDKDSNKCETDECDKCIYSNLCKFKESKEQLDVIVSEEVTKQTDIKLTKEQESIVKLKQGIYRINATAGSGKSTVMVMRFLELVKSGVKPKDVLMITFTNKGASELKDKIRKLSNHYRIYVNINELNIYTFNSFGSMLIENEYVELGYIESPLIASRIDTIDIIRDIINNNETYEWLNYDNPLMNFPHYQGCFIQLLNYFNQIKSFNLTEDTLINKIKCDDSLDKKIISTQIFKMYQEFNQRLIKQNLIQYQDQILLAIELLKDSKYVQKYGYKHIVVDEYQDTSVTQIELLKLLMTYENVESLIVVGDVDQSIYSFQNATPQNMIDFNQDFKNVIDMPMMMNFRSTPEICDLANKFIKYNENRLDFEIVANKNNGESIELLEYQTKHDELEKISNIINELIYSGVSMNDVCIISRTRSDLLKIQNVLTENNIKSNIEVSEYWLDNNYIKSVLGLAKYFYDLTSTYYLQEFVTINNIEYDYYNINELSSHLIEDINIIRQDDTENKLKDELNYFYALLDHCKDEVCLIFIESMKKMHFHTLQQLLTHILKLEKYNDDTTIDKQDVKYNAVTLTTAHSSKGKEWKVVFNTIDEYKVKEIDLTEEERRLLFVSFTRAKDKLYITYNTNQDKSRNKGKTCEFLGEIQECLN